eukprot:TRINITY_DN18357_c0_g1_i1.p1 TRINITY_DN18357_c0_g1~~TRINITY_DN18357_c0_g1_i1.p1  ORF type:complete len:1044 (+),score=127.23 TRINITY_DN18357_c0_g1_i1:59-3190(+)
MGGGASRKAETTYVSSSGSQSGTKQRPQPEKTIAPNQLTEKTEPLSAKIAPGYGPPVLMEAWQPSTRLEDHGSTLQDAEAKKLEALKRKQIETLSPPENTAFGTSEAERTEMNNVLDVARSLSLRLLPERARRALAESAMIRELPAGSQLDDPQTWCRGQCLVLTGQASVRISSSRTHASNCQSVPKDGDGQDFPSSIEVAVLRRGDSFGHRAGHMHSPSFGEDERDAQETWQELRPCLVVTGKTPLRFAQLDLARAARSVQASKAMGFRSVAVGAPPANNTTLLTGGSSPSSSAPSIGERVDFVPSAWLSTSHLAQLWLTATPPKLGVAEIARSAGGALPRAHFHAALWSPLQDRLDELLGEIRRRQEARYRIHDCFPLQGSQIVELKRYILHLTEVWYGAARGGNLSILYAWFIEAMSVLGVTAYQYDALPIEESPDHWTRVVDGEARRAALQGKGSSESTYVATGGISQKQGRSAIDNTILRNMFMPWEARELLTGRILRKFLCKLVALRQRCVLRTLTGLFKLDMVRLARRAKLGTHSGRGHRTVREVLCAATDEELMAIGIDPNNLCFKMLKQTGVELGGFGQLDEELKKTLWDVARALLHRGEKFQRPAEGTPPDVFQRFVTWTKDYPGEYFEHDKQRHITVKLSGLFSGRVVLVKRSAMERMTLARYFPLTWKRQQPLWGSASTGHFQVRPAGVHEGSHVRCNECPYAPLHGMSLSAGSFASDLRSRSGSEQRRANGYTLLMELQWIRDPMANIENWYITDIEKIVQEAWQLNPHGPQSMMLSGEIHIAVGQNPKVGSSIRQTQHTQLAKASWNTHPILHVPASAVFVCAEDSDEPASSPAYSAVPLAPPDVKVRRLGPASLGSGALLEVVDVGPENAAPEMCGTMLRIRLAQPASHGLLRFLIRLRLRLLERIGNAEVLDFLVLCMSDDSGGFVVIFAPIPQLVKMEEGHPDLVPWANPLTGESSETAGIEESRLDFGKGVGHFLVLKPALREQLLHDGKDTLLRIWAFNRVPGARAVIDDFIVEEGILEEEDSS